MLFNYDFNGVSQWKTKFVIYVITNTISKKYYVGQTRREIQYRWNGYKNDLLKPINIKKRSGSNIKLKRSVQKYFKEVGHTDFLEFSILEIVDVSHLNTEEEKIELLDQREIFYIREYRKIYGKKRVFNVLDGGRGYYHTEETKKKLSDDKKGKTYEEIYGEEVAQKKKEKMSKSISGENHPNYGRSTPEEVKEKIREGNKGKILSEETRNKMSESRKGEKSFMYGTHLPEETKKKISDSCKGRVSLAKNKTNVELYGEDRANEIAEKQSKAKMGKTNRAKVIQFPLVIDGIEYASLVSPDGKEYITINNSAEFCREHNLKPQDFGKLLKCKLKSHRDWKLKSV